MRTLPEKFAAENAKGYNKPALLVELQSDVLAAEKYKEEEWAANTAESNVDYTPPIPESGDVELALTVADNITQSSYTGSITCNPWNFPWQSFTFEGTKQLNSIAVRFNESSSIYVRMEIYNSDKSILIAEDTQLIGVSADTTFSFTSLQLEADLYWFKLNVIGSYGLTLRYASPGPYSGGKLWTYNSAGGGWVDRNGDAYFNISINGYQATGYLETDNFNIGATPIENGELQVDDIKPSDSNILYYLRASDVGSFLAGDTSSLGYYADGDIIEDKHPYYRVRAEFSASSGSLLSPTLSKVKLDFSTYQRYESALHLGYEPSVLNIDALETTIDDIEESTVGEISVRLAFTPSVSSWLATKHPKNKIVRVLAGFVVDGFTKQDYIDYFTGQVDDFTIDEDDAVSLSLRDFSTEWEKNIPTTWESSADNVFWTGSHHADVALDILTNHINVRDSKIDYNSFTEVKSDTPGWSVSRSITGNPEKGNDLLNELRRLLSANFIPQADGKITLRRQDFADYTVVASFDDNDFVRKSYDGNLDNTWNEVAIYFGWTGSGDNAEDYPELYTDVDSEAKIRHDESRLFELKDRWTTAAGCAQIKAMADIIMNRYVEPPPIIDVAVDRRYIWLEVGDLVSVTTSRAPFGYVNPYWSEVQCGPSRMQHTSAVVSNELFIYGGWDSDASTQSNKIWKYNPSSDTWTVVGSGGYAGQYIAGVGIEEDIYFLGGATNASSYYADLWKYSVSSDSWTQVSSMASGRYGHSIVYYLGEFFVFGGRKATGAYVNELWKYNISSDTWTEITCGATPRLSHTADISGDNIYIFGGSSASGSRFNDVWVYNISSDTWTEVQCGATGRYYHAAAIIDDDLFIGPGIQVENVDFWRYAISENKWYSLALPKVPFATKRYAPIMEPIDGNLYLHGGYSGASSYYNDTWLYDPSTNTSALSNKTMQVIRRELDFTADTIELSLKYIPQ